MADQILYERNPAPGKLDVLGVEGWPMWEKEPSEFPWTYDRQEVCYILEGRVIVTPDGGQPIELGRGDLVTFPRGMTCTWKVEEYISKHYMFED
jgi:hypothetical protein